MKINIRVPFEQLNFGVGRMWREQKHATQIGYRNAQIIFPLSIFGQSQARLFKCIKKG